jgi:mRNA-degrading endonuclease RelE of RelBE toxin-antitoxin system
MNSQENWDIEVATNVFKAIKKFPRKDARVILEVIELLQNNPYAGDIQKLGGEEHTWRRRVGAYRISYELYPTRKLILVFEVKRRTSHTY